MEDKEEVFLFLSPEVSRTLADNDLDVTELIRRTKKDIEVRVASNPASASVGEKEPATILLASAAVIATATPLIRDIIRTIANRDPVIRERKLVPAVDDYGEVIRNKDGEPVLYWTDEVKGVLKQEDSPPTKIVAPGGFEISFGA